MKIKILSIVLCILISVLALITGCTKEQVLREDLQKNGNNGREKSSNNLEAVNTKEYIEANLTKDKKVSDITWNREESEVIYTKDIGDSIKELYLWRVNEDKEKRIELAPAPIFDIQWSPNGKIIVVSEGTSVLSITSIISSDDFQVLDKVENTAGPIWSPDSNKIVFASLNEKEPIVPMEVNGTSDLYLYDIEERSRKILLEAENNFFYIPLEWNEEGLRYQKFYIDGKEQEEFIYGKENKNDGSYEILLKTYTETNKKVEIYIEYPVVKNMENKDIENKLNNGIKGRVDGYKKLFQHESEGESYKQTISADYEVMTSSKDYISFKFLVSYYTEGAAHPNNFLNSVTFELKTGNELELKDLFRDNIDYKEALNKILNEKVKELDYELFEEYKGIEKDQGFYLRDSSLVIYYQPYVYTPHAVGPLMLEVPFDEIKEIIK